MWYIHEMESFMAVKPIETLVDAVTWMSLENMMLRERSQMQKTSFMIHLHDSHKSIETEMVAQGSGRQVLGVMAKGCTTL